RLNCFFDFQLGGVRRHFKYNLVTGIADTCSLLRDYRAQQDLIDALLVHPSISSNFFIAGTVTITLSKRIRLTGSTPCTSRTSTLCKLRDARNKFSLISSVTISASDKSY